MAVTAVVGRVFPGDRAEAVERAFVPADLGGRDAETVGCFVDGEPDDQAGRPEPVLRAREFHQETEVVDERGAPAGAAADGLDQVGKLVMGVAVGQAGEGVGGVF